MGMILAGYTAIVLCFCLAIGGVPRNLGVAVANYEISEIDRMAGFCPVVSQNCSYEFLSCRYLSILSEKAKLVSRMSRSQARKMRLTPLTSFFLVTRFMYRTKRQRMSRSD